MSEEKASITAGKTSMFSIANIRSSIFAKLESTFSSAEDEMKTSAANVNCADNNKAASCSGENGLHDKNQINNISSVTSTGSENIVIKTELQDDGYPSQGGPVCISNTSEEEAMNCEDISGGSGSSLHSHQTSTKPSTSGNITIRTAVEDSAHPFQGDLMGSSTDFSQLVAKNSEEVIVKQEKPYSFSENGNEETDEGISVTRVEYRIADSYGGDAEDESSDSADSSESDKEGFLEEGNRVRASDPEEDEELFGLRRPKKKNCHGFDDLRTPGEVLPEELPPLEELTIDISEDTELQEIGVVDSIVGILVVIRSTVEHSPLQDDTVFFLEDRKPLGQVFEVMGQVRMPFYSVRFNSEDDVVEKGVEVGKRVFFAPTLPEITHYVFVAQLKKLKGSDASWENNNEPPPAHLEYSDDEQERRAKAKAKSRNRKKGDGDQAGSSSDDDCVSGTEGKKSKRHSKNYTDEEMGGRGRGRRGRSGRGSGRGGGQFQPADQSSGRWPPSDWTSKRFGTQGRPPHFDWDQPGNTGPTLPGFAPAGPQFGQNSRGPQPWLPGGPGSVVLRTPRFPSTQFGPPPSRPSPWGPPPPPPFMPPVSAGNAAPGSYSSHLPFFPSLPTPSPATVATGTNPPVFNRNFPPPPPLFNPNIPPTSYAMPMPNAPPQNSFSTVPSMNSVFASQPGFSAGLWGSGSQGSPFGVNTPNGASVNTYTSPGYSSPEQHSPASASQVNVVTQNTVTSTASAGSKKPVLDTRFIQNSGQ
ncbi:hypothetical protein BaRGS_00026427 [Batillaria attramentaria]|uniref:H/ACA ribonucleoprotein complex non-core subunit NAF1 n=1 Tax=Batillaria attramentaria TaxID=370345 RepID=A0ABD0K4Z2_9CAEN